MIEVFQKAMWPFVFLAGLGVFIDFLLGEKRQERVKLWLMAKWVILDDLRWTNFTEKEARIAIKLFDAFFGSKLLSWRRLLSCVAVTALSIAYWTWCGFSLLEASGQAAELDTAGVFTRAEAILVTPSVLLLAVSISLTRWISLQAIAASLRWRFGYLAFIALLCLHLLLFRYWSPVVEVLRLLTIKAFWGASVSEVRDSMPAAWHMAFHVNIFRQPEAAMKATHNAKIVLAVCQIVATTTVAYVANSVRVLVAAGMLLVFVFRRWIGTFSMLVWQRVIEEKKGAFTLILGGIGALLGVVKELLARI